MSCLTLCGPVNCSTPGFPVLHYPWFIYKVDSVLRGDIWQCLDTLVIVMNHMWEGGITTGIYWPEARDAAEQSTIPKTLPQQRTTRSKMSIGLRLRNPVKGSQHWVRCKKTLWLHIWGVNNLMKSGGAAREALSEDYPLSWFIEVVRSFPGKNEGHYRTRLSQWLGYMAQFSYQRTSQSPRILGTPL